MQEAEQRLARLDERPACTNKSARTSVENIGRKSTLMSAHDRDLQRTCNCIAPSRTRQARGLLRSVSTTLLRLPLELVQLAISPLSDIMGEYLNGNVVRRAPVGTCLTPHAPFSPMLRWPVSFRRSQPPPQRFRLWGSQSDPVRP